MELPLEALQSVLARVPDGGDASSVGVPSRHDAIVAALRCPCSYSDVETSVDVVETHRAWVFLTAAHAYKLAKASPSHVHDAPSLAQRRMACQRELELNRRLGANVYQSVVAVALAEHGYRVEAQGPVVEWLLKMRRLPQHLMLDKAIADGSARPVQIDGLARRLMDFYRSAEPAAMTGLEYRLRLLADIEAKRTSLALERYRIGRESLERLALELREWIEHHAALLDARASLVVDAHGDLRPEHICLEAEPVVIDCLEFARELRLLDPLSEVAFLALECRRLGAAWIGARLLAPILAPLGPAGDALARFYQGYHALLRAAVAIWHLDDPLQRQCDVWRARAERYLRLGLEQLAAPAAMDASSSIASLPIHARAKALAKQRSSR
jgi:aminoglycoside phosphotransferase family enzyme